MNANMVQIANQQNPIEIKKQVTVRPKEKITKTLNIPHNLVPNCPFTLSVFPEKECLFKEAITTKPQHPGLIQQKPSIEDN